MVSKIAGSPLKRLALHGAAWTAGGFALSQTLRFASNLILTRLLAPEMFGLMALVSVVIIGLNLFSDFGIGASVVQNPRGDDPAFYNTAWCVQIVRGFVLWLLALALAWPMAVAYDDRRLLWLLPVVGLKMIPLGFGSTALLSLQRRIDLRRLIVFEMGAQSASIIVMISWAWISPTIWALVAGNLVEACVKLVWSHHLVPHVHNRFIWDGPSLHEILQFGRWILIASALTFLAAQTDRLLLGRLLSLELFGVYTIAFTLADMPRQLIQMLSYRVIFPVLSRRAEGYGQGRQTSATSTGDRNALRVAIIRNRHWVLLALGAFVLGIVAVGDLLVLFLYDDRYAAAAWMLPLLAVGLWPAILALSSSPILLAIGKPNYSALASAARLFAVVSGVLLGFSLAGAVGGIIAIGLADVPVYVVIGFGCWRERLSLFRQDAAATLLFVLLLVMLLLVRRQLGLGFPGTLATLPG